MENEMEIGIGLIDAAIEGLHAGMTHGHSHRSLLSLRASL
jgi:hypothetical protein